MLNVSSSQVFSASTQHKEPGRRTAHPSPRPDCGRPEEPEVRPHTREGRRAGNPSQC